jgi:hypothetical protein
MQHVRNHLVADVPTLDIHEGAFDCHYQISRGRRRRIQENFAE